MSNVIGVRFREEDRKLLEKICRDRREDLSSLIRRSVLKEIAGLGYLNNSQRKSLGIPVDERLKT